MHVDGPKSATAKLPRFDVSGALEEQDEGGDSSILDRDLLRLQLDDLDHWITKVREEEVCIGPLPRPDEEEAYEKLPSVQSLLLAQLHEIEQWLIEVRTPCAAQGSEQLDDIEGPLPELGGGEEEELLAALSRERAWATRRKSSKTTPVIHAQQRIETAHSVIRQMQEAETQRTLALEQARSLGLTCAQDFARLREQLHDLETDPTRAPELARHCATDVALAFVGALEQRIGLAKTLAKALRAQDAISIAAHGHEQLLACAVVSALSLKPPSYRELSEPSPLAVAPAAQIASIGGPLEPTSNPDLENPQVLRVQRLADRNRDLWAQVQAHWTSGAMRRRPRDPEPAPTTAFARAVASRGDAGLSRYGGGGGGGSNSRALQGELQTLRAQESELDRLLAGGGGGREMGGHGKLAHRKNLLPEMSAALKEAEARLDAEFELAQKNALNSMGPFAELTVENIFLHWRRIAHDLNEARKTRRVKASMRLLRSWGAAHALRYLIGRLTIVTHHKIEKPLIRGAHVIDITTQQVGVVLSSTPAGVYKVQFEKRGEKVAEMRPAPALARIEEAPHPYIAGICLHGWAELRRKRLASAVVHFKARMGLKHTTKGPRLLSWMAAVRGDLAQLAAIAFQAWRQSLKQLQKIRNEFLADAFQVWRHGMLAVRHTRAVEQLESTSSELHLARLEVARHSGRLDKIMDKLYQIAGMEGLLFLNMVLLSWRFFTERTIMNERYDEKARARAAQLAAQVFDAMGSNTRRLIKASVVNAWAQRVRRRNASRRSLETISAAFTQSVIMVFFSEWKHLVLKGTIAEFAEDVRCLRSNLGTSVEENKQLQEFSTEALAFSREADRKVCSLEAALQSADRAIEAGVTHSQQLEQEVGSLETQLRAAEARVKRSNEQEKALRNEVEHFSNLKQELATSSQYQAVLTSEVEELRLTASRLSGELQEARRAEGDARSAEAVAKLDCNKALAKAGELLDEDEAAEAIQAAWRRKAERDQRMQEARVRMALDARDKAFKPKGEHLPESAELMDYEKAYRICLNGEEMTMKTSRALSTKSQKLFFGVHEPWLDRFLCYYKDHDMFIEGDAEGAFALQDVMNGVWHGKHSRLTMTKSARKDAKQHTIDMSKNFFHALIVCTREAEHQRIQYELGDPSDIRPPDTPSEDEND